MVIPRRLITMSIWSRCTLAGIISPVSTAAFACRGRSRYRPALGYWRYRETNRGLGGTGMKRFLIIAISSLALTACLHDFRKDASEQQHQIYKDKPIGQGDPLTISCY